MPVPEARMTDEVVRYADLRDIKGQETAKRALEVSAAGGHNLLMVGPPGSGKSMLAQRLPGLLPPLVASEALEVSMVHSVAGVLPQDGLVQGASSRTICWRRKLIFFRLAGSKVCPSFL